MSTAHSTTPHATETGKHRAGRVAADYHKRLDFFSRWKVCLAILALAASLIWLGVALLRGNLGAELNSPGPTAAVHAAWNDNCAACHATASPHGSDNFFAAWSRGDGALSASEQRCQTCHGAPKHHDNELAGSVPRCGGCHHEHRGRDHNLARADDAACTSCHAGLSAHANDASKIRCANAIHSFAGDHPPFRPRDNPRQLKFDHKRHLLPGQMAKDARRSWTLGDIKKIAPDLHEQYRSASWQTDKADSARVKLECASCHQLDAAAHGTPRAEGAYFPPTAYDNHCRACHPLTFDKDVTGPNGSLLAAPHRLQVDELDRFLWGAYANRFLDKHPELDVRVHKSLQDVKPLLPGRLSRAEEAARDEIIGHLTRTRHFLFREDTRKGLDHTITSCAKCHHFDWKDSRPVSAKPTNRLGLWFASARFSHAAHRALDCKACHENATTTEKFVDMPAIDVCRKCHAPATGITGGARHDCVECHRYHNGEHPRQGLGARHRDPEAPLDISSFLKGRPASKHP